jgi:hypothetical protein
MSASQAPIKAAKAGSCDCNIETMPYALAPPGTARKDDQAQKDIITRHLKEMAAIACKAAQNEDALRETSARVGVTEYTFTKEKFVIAAAQDLLERGTACLLSAIKPMAQMEFKDFLNKENFPRCRPAHSDFVYHARQFFQIYLHAFNIMCTENEFMAAAWTAYSKTPHHLREDSTSSSNDWNDWAEEAFKQFYRFKWAVYWGRSFSSWG